MKSNELILLAALVYALIGALTLYAAVLGLRERMTFGFAAFSLFCWPYFAYKGAEVLLRRAVKDARRDS